MRPGDEHRHDSHGSGRGSGQGGVPDGLLVGILAFLLGMTLLVWTATGLSALLAHGSWPSGVTFTRTPLAMRHLIAQPHDVPGAWPDADPTGFSGYGLFWGLLIGQLMILLVLTVFVMGTLARWRAVRAHRRADRSAPVHLPEPQHHEVPTPRTEATATDPAPQSPSVSPAAPPADRQAVTAPPSSPPLPPSPSHPDGPRQPDAVAVAAPAHAWETSRSEGGTVHYAPPATRFALASQAVRDAAGPALVLTSDPALWQDTKDGRAKLGPVHLYDPAHRCDTPARLHWSPIAGCEDRTTAGSRAAALLTPVRPTARLDQAVAETAEILLRSYLHAAAVDGRTVRHVHRWSQGAGVQEAVRTLRTSPKAAPGAAGELEAALTAHPERRDIAQELTARALSALSTVNIREACTPNRTDALALDSFVDEGGTLYVLGESLEDPRTSPGAMPLLTALVSSVVERGRRMAERSSSGRLDPPLTLVLDDVAAVAPIPQLPELLAAGPDRGLPTLALLRSREQARARWPHHELPV
ncbi:type IV secretory system conjugative DNA transfer family protein [Streptomyces sp. FL07-04A]|uniref:type IV secretory system conjugative DNA transfer family protein n=1 Tax=Streptomyces sp. FL07-04A TaxID=3028658 RepID=UPI0029B0F9D6|nr:type IV secretory system conjugative DNA transfer family protein [Streptomyces sp. FL07-04A]MDX3579674.1 type IV secretory system conjugative DNA transfer family protein [Streptomyces sp. FL07-04A]